MYKSSFALAALAVGLALAGAGCGGGKDKPGKVEGIVRLDGEPLAGATVLFTPEDGKGQSAYGLTGDDGTFRLSCQNGVDGAFPGQYKVTITPPGNAQEAAIPTTPEERQKMADKMLRAKAIQKAQNKRSSASKRPSILPAVYTDEHKTPLRQTVPPPEGKVTLDLHSHKL